MPENGEYGARGAQAMRDPSAILVPSAEWQGLDLSDAEKAEWMTQVEPPPEPKWREERRTKRAIDSIDAAARHVMDLFGGNLDHPALPFLEAAEQVVREVARGEDWHEFDCGPVGGGWPHPARAHIERVSCATCGWSGNRRLTTPSRARAGGCDDIWHTPTNRDARFARLPDNGGRDA